MKNFWAALILLLSSVCSFAAAEQQPLPVDEAFQFSLLARDSQTVIAHWDIEPGYFLYKARFRFQAVNPEISQLGDPLMPAGIDRNNSVLGDYQVYEHSLDISIPILSSAGAYLSLVVDYQGCSLYGYCYPPTQKVVRVNLQQDFMQPVSALDIDIAPQKAEDSSQAPAAQLKIINILKDHSLIWALIAFLGFGILISLTPCILPMLPILSSIILGQKHLSWQRSFLLSLSYVLGMAGCYALIGLIFGFIGSNLQTTFQSPWVIVIFSLIFIAMALSLFGLYELRLPAGLQNRLNEFTQFKPHHTYGSVALMGALSTLVVSPCVTPPLVGVIGYISQNGNPILGASALFMLGLGMGAPLLIIGLTGAKFLPKAGRWMESIKRFLALLMLGVAITMLSRIIAAQFTIMAWILLSFLAAYVFGAFSSSKNGPEYLAKALGILIFIYGILLGVNASQGQYNPLTPLAFLKNESTVDHELTFTRVKTLAQLNEYLTEARTNHQPVILDFYADWCVACKEMDEFTFTDETVKQALKPWLLLRVDVTANDDQDKELLKQFGVVAPPTIVFFDVNGEWLKNSTIVGEMKSQEFLKVLQTIKPKSKS